MPRVMTDTEANVLVEGLWSAVDRGAPSIKDIPQIIKRVIQTDAWRRRRLRNGKIVEHSTFRAFITTKPLDGCGYDPKKIYALIKGEPETEVLWREAMKGKQGTRSDLVDNVNEVKSSDGNSRSYTLTRLKHQKPELFQDVVDGKLSANAAAIAAGFRKKRSPLQNLRAAWAKATADERRQFLSEVACP